MNFLTQIDNLALIALLLVSGAALFLPTLSTLIGGKGLSPSEATIWINRRKAYVLDLRSEEEFKAGHLPGAKFANSSALTAAVEKLKLDRKLPVVLVCDTGAQSRKLLSETQKLGFAEVGVFGWWGAGLESSSPPFGEVRRNNASSNNVQHPGLSILRHGGKAIEQKGVTNLEKILIDRDPSQRESMMTRTGRRTVPQIYIGDTHVGGYDDLVALDRAGKLDPLLA